VGGAQVSGRQHVGAIFMTSLRKRVWAMCASAPGRSVRSLGVMRAISTMPFSGGPREIRASALATSSAAIGWMSAGGSRTVLPSVASAAMPLMNSKNWVARAAERGDVRFVHQSLYYPVTDAAMDTDSYEQFAEGHYLTAKAMAWFWDAYAPDLERRSEPFASPLRDEQLAGLPPAFVIVDEADVLRDEGEAYAARLRAAGVAVTTVRYDGITHDFMMLNPLSGTHATRGAVAQAIAVLRDALHGA
jgi:acetyl esterase